MVFGLRAWALWRSSGVGSTNLAERQLEIKIMRVIRKVT